jgi:hypothetical protein
MKGIKKAEKLSQYFGPTSTYEKHPLRRVLNIIQNTCLFKKRPKRSIKALFNLFAHHCVEFASHRMGNYSRMYVH